MKPLPRHTKIIATIGPSTESEANLQRLIEANVDVLRLNMAHADHDWVRLVTDRIRKISTMCNREPAIMMDVKGPEIRTGILNETIHLKKNDLVDFSHGNQTQDLENQKAWKVEVSYEKLHEHLEIGGKVLLDNGLIQFEVIGKFGEVVRCRSLQDAKLGSRRHVNLPGAETDLP